MTREPTSDMSAMPSAQDVSLEFDLDVEAPSRVRMFVADILGTHRRISDILLATSELVTNAVRHAPDSRTASVVVQNDDSVRVVVQQRGSGFHRPEVVASEPHGRGLHIVEAVSDDWGVDVDGETLTVWFEIAG